MRRSTAPALLALLAPLVVAGVAVWALQRPLPVGQSDAAARLDAYLARAERQVIVIGNSLAVLDVNPALLATRLGIPTSAVATLEAGYAKPPTFFAMLDNRVYGNGHRPELVLVVATPRQLLDVAPTSADQLDDLVAQLDDDDVALREKVFGPGGRMGLLDRMSGHRVRVREALFERVEVAAVGLATGEPTTAKDRADAAIAEVLGGNDLRGEQVGVVEAPAPRRYARQSADPAESFLPDLIASAHAHGARIVFVRPPLTTWMAQTESLSPEDQAAMEAFLRAQGAGYLDFSALPVTQADFMDLHHLAESGRTVMTEALATALRDAGDGVPFVTLTPARTDAQARRVGAGPAGHTLTVVRTSDADPCRGILRLPREYAEISDPATVLAGLGRASPLRVLQDGTPLVTRQRAGSGCNGAAEHVERRVIVSALPGTSLATAVFDVGLDPAPSVQSDRGIQTWWVYPGTELEWLPATLGPGEVRVVAVAIGEGREHARLECGDRKSPLTGTDRLEGTCRYTGGAIRVRSGRGGRYLVVRALWWRADGAETWLVGDPTTAGPRRFGVVDAPGFEVSFDGEPAPLAHGEARVADGVVSFDVPAAVTGMRWLSSRCSALRMTEDGVQVDVPDVTDRLWQADGRFWYRPEGDPAGHRYAPVLDPARRCWERLWVYPGDAVEAVATAPYRVGAVDLGVKVYGDVPDGAALHVAAGAGDALATVADLPISALAADGYVTVALPAAIGDAGPPRIRLWSDPGSPFLMLMHVHALEAVD